MPNAAPAPIEIPLSVRWLAEFMLRGGSIDSRFTGLDRGVQGTRLHRWLQKQGGAGYSPEVSLSIAITQGEFCYQLSGRADGVIEADGGVSIDEIKTTAAELATLNEDDHPAHWAQGRIYAHILCQKRGLDACGMRLSYCNIETGAVRRFARSYTAAELEDFVNGLLAGYRRWAELSVHWQARRNAGLKKLAFPFGGYRAGQRAMAVGCYNTYKAAGRLFCCAPTGIGKTISALFPAMKALGEGFGRRIFYLTAKTIARTAAVDALARLRASESGQGLPFHGLTLTAKDKICFLEERACLPEVCPYANGYYDRVNDAVYELLQTEADFSRRHIEEAAEKYKLCPYELSLDLALWCDCVICDYNYLFDPVVHLQRFFEQSGGEHLFLVDEAHNLVDRSREMYSARLRKSDFFAFKKELPKQYTRLHKALAGLNTAFVGLRKVCEEENARVLKKQEPPEAFILAVEKFCAAAEAFLEDHRGSPVEDALLALYFEALFFTRIADEYDHSYTTLIFRYQSDVTLKLFCLDPASRLEESMDKGRAAVLFSATLQPLGYYRETLGGGAGAKLLALESPFAPEHLGLFVADGLSTKYAHREQSAQSVADMLAAMAAGRRGNYIAYFPSYSYMRQVWELFEAGHPEVDTLVQQSGMDEAAREDFLAAFSGDNADTLLGFCVMGGIFAEGVDLPGNRLIGTAVVGVGLPQLGPEPDAIREYYDEVNGRGFEYAYQYPGMNKVLQAAGRVIRTETDKGVVLLIDSRFATPRYQQMFPPHWSHWKSVDAQSLPRKLAAFWAAE